MTNNLLIEVTIPGKPFAQPRPRMSKKTGRAYKAQKQISWEAKTRAQVLSHIQSLSLEPPVFPRGTPVGLQVRAVFELPKAKSRKRSPVPLSYRLERPDMTNIIKAVEDALNEILWADDKQIVQLVAIKLTGRQGESPKTEISAWEVRPPDAEV